MSGEFRHCFAWRILKYSLTVDAGINRNDIGINTVYIDRLIWNYNLIKLTII
jgi:hypothetical protein